MLALVVVSLTGFTGYAALLPVAPLWAVHGGANPAGAGLVNGTLLLATILTQLLVPAALRRFGWGPVMAAGMVLLGVPALLYALSDGLGPILALSALRGIGFGILTVTGSAATALLVEPSRRGEAIGIYGLAIALPNLLLLPIGPWAAAHLGYTVVFVVSAAPLLGIPAAIRLAHAVQHHLRSESQPEHHAADLAAGLTSDLTAGTTSGTAPAAGSNTAAYRRLARPTILLLGVTLAGGAVLTFSPQMVTSPLLTAAGLFLMGLVAAVTRWYAGLLADRHGDQRFAWPLVITTTIGMAVIALSVRDPAATDPALFLIGMAVVGISYGALQSLTLVIAFASVSRAHHNLASAVWNIGFDAGTAIGSVLVGTLAVATSFPPALLAAAALSLLTLPLALHRGSRGS